MALISKTNSTSSLHLCGVGRHGEGVDVEARRDHAQEDGVEASRKPARSFVVPVFFSRYWGGVTLS